MTLIVAALVKSGGCNYGRNARDSELTGQGRGITTAAHAPVGP